MEQTFEQVRMRIEAFSALFLKHMTRLLEWAAAHPIDAAASAWFCISVVLGVYIARSGRYIAHNTSSMLWSFVAFGGYLTWIALALQVSGRIDFAIENMPLTCLAAFGLIGMSYVTHKYTS